MTERLRFIGKVNRFQFHKVQFKECGKYGEQLYERGFNSIRYNLKNMLDKFIVDKYKFQFHKVQFKENRLL